MAKKIIIGIIVFIFIIFQISGFSGFFSGRTTPNLILIFLIFWTARKGVGKTWKLAILGGLFFDLFLFVPVGMNIFSFILTVFVTDYLSRRFLITHQAWYFFILVALIAVGTLVNEAAFLGLTKIFIILGKINRGPFQFFEAMLAYKIIYNISLFIILYWPFKKMEAFFNLYGSRAELKNYVR